MNRLGHHLFSNDDTSDPNCADNDDEPRNITLKPAVISIQKLVAPPYLPDFRNPCWWHDAQNSTLLCLPYFFLAGFPKSGTSDLHQRLLVHPLTATSLYKEIHFLTREMFNQQSQQMCAGPANVSHNCFIEYYARTYFSQAAKNIYSNTQLAVDSSASTAWDSYNWDLIQENQRCDFPLFIMADMIVKVMPNARIIMILREPVDRAHSDYVYFTKNPTATDFHAKILMFIQYFHTCLKQHPLRRCVHKVKDMLNFQTRARLDIGIYYVYVADWLERIPRDRLLLIRTEDYSKDMAKTLAQIFDFLQLPQPEPEVMKIMVSMERANGNSANREKTPMLPESRTLLSKFYQTYNKKLADLLGDQRFLWNDRNLAT